MHLCVDQVACLCNDRVDIFLRSWLCILIKHMLSMGEIPASLHLRFAYFSMNGICGVQDLDQSSCVELMHDILSEQEVWRSFLPQNAHQSHPSYPVTTDNFTATIVTCSITTLCSATMYKIVSYIITLP